MLKALNNAPVENIYIYVGDAVRYDFFPDEISNKGLSIKAIAGGIHSPTSFATILSGVTYPHHGVGDFGDQIANDAPHLLKSETHNTAFSNTINQNPFNSNPNTKSIIVDTLDTSNSQNAIIGEMDPPFLLVERGPGGHAPYGDYDGDATEYFDERGAQPPENFVHEYMESVEKDKDHFLSQLAVLEKRDLLDNTLVIYTSDHGELLGEMGMLGHNGPIHKKLVEVPCVFIHPQIVNRNVEDHMIRHIDIGSTIKAATSIQFRNDEDLQGVNLINGSPPSTGISYYNKQPFADRKYLSRVSLSYESIWDAHGGYVVSNSGPVIRLGAALRSMFKGPKKEYYRKNFTKVMYNYFISQKREGTPELSQSQAINRLDEDETGVVENEEIDVQKERLRELGYLE